MTEHHREYDDEAVWKASNENRQDISELKSRQAKTDANYEHIKESLARLESSITAFAEQSRIHIIEDGKYYARTEQAEKDVNNLAAKLRDHIDNHKFWLGLTLGIPAALLAAWTLFMALVKKAGG